MDNKETYDFDSKCAMHYNIKGPVNSVAPPIYTSSTYYVDSADHGAVLCAQDKPTDGRSEWLYTRWGNPTNEIPERMITQLEGGYATILTSSGMAAITSSILALLKTGDHAVFSVNIYGGTYEFITDLLPKMGISVDIVDPRDINNYASKIKDNTKLLYGETPANPTLILTDIAALAALGKQHGIPTMVDSTFGSVYNQKPITYGIDIVLHSATKYYSGHTDLVAGTITCASADHYKHISHYVRLLGGTPSPFTGYLLQRGIKTLHLRMPRHNENALTIARFLEKHPKIETVHYPGLESHPQHELAKKQMQGGFGGIIAFTVKGGAEAGRKVIESVQLITLAVSLGGVESLIEQASTMTHIMVPKEERERGGIADGLLRFSVGCENVQDLIQDLTNALNQVVV
ncbi:hypothetical protein DFA_05934 [Cavenderia fasciculata]|uniref:cystathionine gamma-lyase n=1 Tax=Cavenderia fasciculata TaxID=261658 RepID=F4PJM4_CACFS|nr:uncharacterized protein DFA_05934 [Cavenderia fasciculata]EGG23798.1 hypothetical protein DFA_05934 [Cavenderia fasciculata]|eukprot:XP_004361649.1 hypothetical protein DFA_05934 [Cavenderia fasciculata]